MADRGAGPLPQRTPGDKRHVPGSEQGGPVGPAALPEDVLQRIRSALEAMRSGASPQEDAPRAGGPASALPGRPPGASKDPQPPAAITRPELPALWPYGPNSSADEAPTEVFPPVGAARSGGYAEEITVRLVGGEQPEPAAAAAEPAVAAPETVADQPEPAAGPAGPEPAPTPRPTAEDQPGRQGRPEEGTAHRGGKPSRQINKQARRAKPVARGTKSRVRRTKPPARAPRLALRRRPSPSQQPAQQMAAVFPPESAPEEATIRPSTSIVREQDLWTLGIGCGVLVLIVLFVVALIFLL